MRPSRIIVGEVRQEESLDLLIALNSGLPGMCSLHANSAREAVVKLCTLPLLAGENVTASFVVPTVASSVDIVVHIALSPDGSRQVREIVALPGRVEGGVVEIAGHLHHGRREPDPRPRLPTPRGSLRPGWVQPGRTAGRFEPALTTHEVTATPPVPDRATRPRRGESVVDDGCFR